jgi:2-hydroxymethylglutarate dehydrogenase
MNEKRIGFIGLGAMGAPMAKHLLKAGYRLRIFDLDPQPMAELKAVGAVEAGSAAAAAQEADVIITVLPACENVKAAVLGAKGVLEAARSGAVLIDMSSIAPHTSRLVADAARAKGIMFMDAPVSGGTIAAENGTLTIMVGGDKELLEEQRDILEAMGKTIYHVGGIGMGETIKMINQVLVGINILAIAEAFVLGTKLGADPEVLYDVIRKSAGNSFLIDHRVPDYILKGDFTQPGFSLDLLLKDVGLAVESARIEKVPLFLTAQAFQCLTMASASGRGRQDMSSVIEILEEAADVKVRAK